MAFDQSQKALVTFICLLFALDYAAAAESRLLPPGDPFADPKHDPYNPLKYIASNTLTAISFSLILSVAISQTYCTFRWGARWMLSLVIGSYLLAFGLSTRFGLHLHPQSRGLYIIEYLFVVLAPCAYIAADYVLLGKLARHLDADEYLLIAAQRITIAFVSSDITTFLIQAAGGALSASANSSHTNFVGSRIFLAGLIIQLISFVIFTSLYIVFIYRVYTRKPHTWRRDQAKAWYNDWRTLGAVLFISCVGILIRSLFRVIELSEGYQGRLATSEAFFYGLDTLPLFFAIVLYTPFWPGRFIREPSPPVASIESEIVEEAKH
ncbi:Protein RTA1 [Hypsizygus marmoreus]|uniref:Protein RTA1 n=1 Tax=Hypsizygus marmoreus TaxID=39966 RepID=A0A369JKC9_HYPMA|nr:Protein RTA1 [Hypsizygus marmoreus]